MSSLGVSLAAVFTTIAWEKMMGSTTAYPTASADDRRHGPSNSWWVFLAGVGSNRQVAMPMSQFPPFSQRFMDSKLKSQEPSCGCGLPIISIILY
jgi:hypothetical protein